MMFDGTFNNITVISWCLTLREIRFKCLNMKKKLKDKFLDVVQFKMNFVSAQFFF